jgi:hypothetical protein
MSKCSACGEEIICGNYGCQIRSNVIDRVDDGGEDSPTYVYPKYYIICKKCYMMAKLSDDDTEDALQKMASEREMKYGACNV